MIDLRTINPWDKEAVFGSVRKTGKLVIAHEAVKSFGVGAEIAATVQDELFSSLKAPIKRVGAPFTSVPFTKALEDEFLVSAAKIADAVRSIVGAVAEAA